MEKLSACLVVYNEEKLIRKCLDSLAGVVDEIIVVHDGKCSDNTLKIAKKYASKVYVRAHVGEAEPHRLFSFSKARNDWILLIDADEYLSEGLRRNINKIIQRKGVAAYGLLYEVFYNGKLIRHGLYGSSFRPVLFRRSGMLPYLGQIHEFPRFNGKVVNVRLLLHHRPAYNNFSFDTFRKKWLKWARIEAERKKAILPRFFYLFKAPFAFLFHFAKLFLKGSLLSGTPGLKISFLHSLYYFYVNYYIWRGK